MRIMSKRGLFVLYVNIAFLIFSALSSLYISQYYLFYLFIGCFIIKLLPLNQRNYQLFFEVYLFYSIYATITHLLLIKDPSIDYFIASDQLTFYEAAVDISNQPWSDFWEYVFTKIEYLEYTLAALLFGSLAKIGSSVNYPDLLLFLKFHVVLFASLVIILMYAILKQYFDKVNINSLLYFSLLTPLFSYSAMLLRDIHVCFFYILTIYVVLKDRCNYRYLILLFLAVMLLLIRVENGMFAILFFALRISIDYKKMSQMGKLFLIIGGVILAFVSIHLVWSTTLSTLTSYQTRDLDAATIGSLGAKLKSLPIPFNIVFPTLFSQIMPFPIWSDMMRDGGGGLLFVNLLSSVYWLYIWIVIVYMLAYHRRRCINFNLLFSLLCVCVLYITLTSIGEMSVRRMFAVYPILFLIYYMCKDKISQIIRLNLLYLAFSSLFILHAVYLYIK